MDAIGMQGLLDSRQDFGRYRLAPASHHVAVRAHQVEAAARRIVEGKQPARMIPASYAARLRSQVPSERNEPERYLALAELPVHRLELLIDAAVLGDTD